MPSRQPDQTRRHTQELTYAVEVKWTGNRGEGTRSYATYARDHEPTAPEKPPIPGSSDPAFRGDASRYNPDGFGAATGISFGRSAADVDVETVIYGPVRFAKLFRFLVGQIAVIYPACDGGVFSSWPSWNPLASTSSERRSVTTLTVLHSQ
jgi:hypothetical protein